MSLQDLEKKIEILPDSFTITDEDLKFAIDGNLIGSYQTTTTESSLVAGEVVVTERQKTITYIEVFERRFKNVVKEKSYQNLSYNELRYGINLYDEDSNDFKQLVKNLTNDALGSALDEFSLSQFDSQVSTAINDKIKKGGSIQYSDLPLAERNPTTGYVSVIGENDYLAAVTSTNVPPELFDQIVQTYQTQNGTNILSKSGRVLLDNNLQLQGNAGSITNEFKLERVNAGGAGLIDAIIDFFVDYKSPAGIINTKYKNFLVQSLKDPLKIENNFTVAKSEATDDIIYYLTYDFEYERRIAIPAAIDSFPPGEATAEDILGAAESAALESLADSGLAGEGGVGTEEFSPEEIEERQRFFEQCALLATMDDFQINFDDTMKLESDSESETEKIHDPRPYQERFYMVNVPSGRNDRLVNFLNAPSDNLVNDFLNLTPDIQSFLVPKLRLYKVFNEGNKLKQVEFVFKNSTDSTNLLKQMFNDNDKFFRGSGYGIKSFSYSFNGTTPATAKNDITADLTLYFQDFSDFVTPIETSEGTFKFVDLIFYDKKNTNNPTYGYGNTHPDQYSPAYFRIRADVGWHVPKDITQFDDACRKRNINPDNVRSVIEKTNKSYYLNMVEHELDFKKDGTVEIKAQYRGYIESVLKGTTMDALTDKTVIDDRKSRQNALEVAKRSCTPGELAKIKRIYAAEELVLIEKLYTRTYDRLLKIGKVRTFQVQDDGGFRKNGYFSKKPSIYIYPDTISTANEEVLDDHTFYFLGDLLYVMLDAIYDNNNIAEPLGKTKFILPTIEFESFFEEAGTFSINIAQIPISHRYFSEWWTQHVVKAKKRSYPIMFYLRDILNNLIADALIDTCLNRNYNKSFNFQTTTINASEDPLAGISSTKKPIIQLSQDKLPFTVSEDTDINEITNYVLVFASHSTTLPSGFGNYTEDIKNGVYHFHLGQDRGLIYDIKFNKVDMSYIREARFQREGVDGLLQLGAVYRVSMNMFGNSLFYPGMLIYINPFGIGGEEFLPNKDGSIANQLGLGGYHIIEKVNSSIAGGIFKTSVEAMFVYSGDGDSRFKIQGKQKESDEDDVETPTTEPPKCANLVSAVRADYLNAVGGDTTDLTEQAIRNIEQRESSPLSSPAINNDGEVVPEGSIDTDGDGIPDNFDVTPQGGTISE